jgi:ubiquinone biosynthesis protein UbiJ
VKTEIDTRVWMATRVEGSLPADILKDLASSEYTAYERVDVLDAIERLVEAGDLKVEESGRLYQNRVLDHEAGGYASALEERLDNAWPRAGGRREIVRALAEEVQELADENEELRERLKDLRYERRDD